MRGMRKHTIGEQIIKECELGQTIYFDEYIDPSNFAILEEE